MSKQKNKYSVAKVINRKGQVIGYLSTRDEENGVDIQMNMKGYTVIAL